MTEVMRSNQEQLERKKELREQEKEEERRIAEYIRLRDAREEAAAAEKERLTKEKARKRERERILFCFGSYLAGPALVYTFIKTICCSRFFAIFSAALFAIPCISSSILFEPSAFHAIDESLTLWTTNVAYAHDSWHLRPYNRNDTCYIT